MQFKVHFDIGYWLLFLVTGIRVTKTPRHMLHQIFLKNTYDCYEHKNWLARLIQSLIYNLNFFSK